MNTPQEPLISIQTWRKNMVASLDKYISYITQSDDIRLMPSSAWDYMFLKFSQATHTIQETNDITSNILDHPGRHNRPANDDGNPVG